MTARVSKSAAKNLLEAEALEKMLLSMAEGHAGESFIPPVTTPEGLKFWEGVIASAATLPPGFHAGLVHLKKRKPTGLYKFFIADIPKMTLLSEDRISTLAKLRYDLTPVAGWILVASL